MKRRSETISFRVDSQLANRVDEACQMFPISRGEWVRGLVTTHLYQLHGEEQNDRLRQMEEALAELSIENQRTQTLLKQMLFVTLTVGCGVSSEDATRSVRKVLASTARGG